MASALLQQLLGAIRQGTEAAEVHAALGCGLSELGLLSASIKSQHECSEGADEVVGRAQTLLGAKQAASKRLGLQLLHALIADCDRATFVAHHAEWASTLLTMLRGSSAGSPDSASGFKAPCGAGCLPPADTLAAWDCLAVLYARLPALLGVPGVRRDASAAASRLAAVLLLQPAQGEGGGGDAVTVPPALYLPAAQRALLAALDALPAAFRQQQRALEAPLAALLLRAGARGAPGEQLRLAAALVASLPRIQGDADSWSSMAQRLLATMHALLDAAYLSLEERGLAAAARGACDPNAEPLGPLACASGSENAGAGGLDAYPATLGQLAAALEALVALLSRSYPSAVPLPSGGLLLLASRLLSLDDSAAASAVGRGARFAQLCWRLPSLHAAALRVLAQALASGGSQLAPLFMAAARLLGDQLQRTAGSVAAAARGGVSERRGVQEGGALVPAAPAVRAGLYAAVRQLLLASGAGVVRPLAPAVLAAVGAELYGRRLSQAVGGGPGSSGGAGMPALEAEPARKKARKSKQQQGSENIGAAPNDDLGAARQQADMAAQAAALELLGTLLGQGAALLSPPDRAAADAVAVHAASTAASAAAAAAGSPEAPAHACGAAAAALLLESHRALLASVLAPAPHRPRYLPTALALFRRGRAGSDPALSALCSQALASCDALLHPRAPPPPPAAAATLAVASAAAPELGMPRFWSASAGGGWEPPVLAPVMAAAAARPAAQQAPQQLAAEGQRAGGDTEMAEAAEEPAAVSSGATVVEGPWTDAASPPVAPAEQPAASTAPFAALASTAAPAPVLAAAPAVATPQADLAVPELPAPQQQQQQLQQQQPPVAAAQGPAAPKPAQTVAAAAAAAMAAGEESDSEGSLPEIDSGASDSDTDSSDDEHE